ncbi:hypothetical protein KAS08_00345 [Candidatus Pacearchaeota archaeon]|nr:hypothetical protein [Candidatus Pacearchaeota archaeon]
MTREIVKSSIYFKWAAIIGVPMGIVVFATLLPLFLLYGNGSMQIRIASVILAIGYFIILKISLKKFKACYPFSTPVWFSDLVGFIVLLLGVGLPSIIAKSFISFELFISVALFSYAARRFYSKRVRELSQLKPDAK